MKKTFLLLALAFVFIGCDKNDKPVAPEKEYVNVNFSLTGENIEFQTVPLKSSSGSSDIYVFNVYNLNTNTSKYEYYCCGVFDDLSKANVQLEKNSTYKFRVAMFAKCFNSLTHFFLDPEHTKITSATNKMTYNSSYIYDLDYGYYHTTDTDQWTVRPPVDSYHGVKDGYMATNDGTISMTLSRGSFGLDIDLIGFEEGSISGQLYSSKYYNYIQPSFSIVYPANSFSEIYTMIDPLSDSDSMKVLLTYIDSEQKSTEIVNEDIKFERNVRVKMTITLKKKEDPNTNNSFDIHIDTTPFTDKEINYDRTI